MRRGHSFLAQATSQYKECKDCNKRTPHVCIKCGLCYSCHWISEQARPSVVA
ncbi:MAG TPA: hypothetical protein VGA14_02950 [Nitrososphaera sp.]